MQKAIAKFTRINHQKHIIDVMPLIAAVFGVQCYLMGQFSAGISIGDLALAMAGGLVSFVAGLFWYDKKHRILIFSDRIESGFNGLGGMKTIMLKEIASIEAPEDEKNFSSLLIMMANGSSHVFYFIDYPKASKAFLEERISLLLNEAKKDAKGEGKEDQNEIKAA